MDDQPVSYPARLRQLAAARQDTIALHAIAANGEMRSLTWAELDRLTDRLAHGLAARGVVQGSVVGIALGNVAEHIATALAIWRIGATTLVMDPAVTEDSAQSLLARTGAKLIVGNGRRSGDLLPADLVATGEGCNTPLPDLVSDPGKIVLSGGSTGMPKLMADLRPHERIPGESWGRIAPALGFRCDQVQLVCAGMSHNAPFTWAQNGLFEGNTLILMEKFDAAATLAAIDRHRVGFIMLVPTMMVRLLDALRDKPASLASLHTLYHTGAPCPIWLKQAWIDLLGPERITEMYGSGENTGQTVITGTEWLSHQGSVGKGFETDIRICGPDGEALAEGGFGEIFMRPHDPSGRSEYIGSSPPAPRRTSDGYQSIGDFGRLDADGYLYLSGRSDDVINTGGVKLHPEAIEAALMTHPDLLDVAVFGVPDREWGERVVAAVTTRNGQSLTAEKLASFARTLLSPEEVPKEWRFVETLGRDSFGKLRRSSLRPRG